MSRSMMANRMMVREWGNRCPHCGKRVSNAVGSWIEHHPFQCEKNPDVIRQKLQREIEELKLKNN
jgi:hypothetical protein